MHSEIWVCVDCLMALANGDTSGASDDWDESALTEFELKCADEKIHLTVTSEEDTDKEFSAQPCGACNSHLAGSRHSVALLENKTLHISDDSAREVIDGYRDCAQWLTTDDDGDSVDHVDLSDSARGALADDCVNFLASIRACWFRQYEITGSNWEQFGHDFFLTRNHHGAGFWDRGNGAIGDTLTKAAQTEGARDLFLNEDTNEIEVY